MPTLETIARNAGIAAIADTFDGGSAAGYMQFETSGDVEVATVTFSDPAFGSPSTGTVTANSITGDSDTTGGEVEHASCYDSDDTKLMELTVGTSGTDVIVSTTTIPAGITLNVSSMTMTLPASPA